MGKTASCAGEAARQFDDGPRRPAAAPVGARRRTPDFDHCDAGLGHVCAVRGDRYPASRFFVRERVVPRSEYSQDAIVAEWQDAVLDRPRRCRFPDFVGMPGRVLHPVQGVVLRTRLRDFGRPSRGRRLPGKAYAGLGLWGGGCDCRIGLRVTPAGGKSGFSFNLKGTRSESADVGTAEHSIMLADEMHW